jgi:ketosteroid isomerase-like protein
LSVPAGERDTGRAMSQENVEVVRRVLEAFRHGRIGEALSTFDPEIKWEGTENTPGRKPYHGLSGVRQFFDSWLSVWADYDIELDRLIDAGEAVVSIGRERARGKASGAGVARGHFGVYRFRDGKIVAIRFFDSESDALAAVGLRK